MEPDIVFPNAPNEMIDLTENELTKFVIAFSTDENEPSLDDELDGQLEWFGNFPGPIEMKTENQADNLVQNGEIMNKVPFEEQNGNIVQNDALLGDLPFKIVCFLVS